MTKPVVCRPRAGRRRASRRSDCRPPELPLVPSGHQRWPNFGDPSIQTGVSIGTLPVNIYIYDIYIYIYFYIFIFI